jgi:hypothetical protein
VSSRVFIWRQCIRDVDDLDHKAKAVGLVLSTYMNGRGECINPDPLKRPSRASLVRGTGLSDKSVDRGLARLEERGWLAIDPPAMRRVHADGRVVYARPGGSSGPNKYVAQLPPSADMLRTAEWASAESAAPECGRSGPRVRNSSARKREKASESGALDAAAAPEGAAARALTLDDCGACGKRRPLVDDIYCEVCDARRQVDTIITGVRRDLEDARATIGAREAAA